MSRNETKRSSCRESRREDDLRYRREKHRDERRRKSEKHISSRFSRSDREAYKISDVKFCTKNSLSRNSFSESHRGDGNEGSYFSKCKNELNKIFTTNPNLVQDVVDFWKFVEKYESVEKQLGNGDESATDPALNSIGLPEKYYKSHCLNFKLGLSYGELFAKVLEANDSPLIESRLLEFRDVILLYLDFKQKEKFGKLKKLRDAQANLPVARYQNEIIEMVKAERVIVLAGDTGCGKSTQIPRYLYEAGFRKIGKLILS